VPFVVLRKKPLKLIRGEDYKEGLDLELEDTIDFTDPNDPHPWIEGMAAVGPMQNVHTDNDLSVWEDSTSLESPASGHTAVPAPHFLDGAATVDVKTSTVNSDVCD
jgi:hypothetical protein